MERIDLGLYLHFKGGLYSTITAGRHHDTRGPMVVYMSCTTGEIFIRPIQGEHVLYQAG